jgi:hypothetical protein
MNHGTINSMIRTTVMLPEVTHERLRRIARRHGVPLAHVIREALVQAAEAEPRQTLSFIGVDGVDSGTSAAGSAEAPPPLSPFRTGAPTRAEIERYRRLAERRARDLDRC